MFSQSDEHEKRAKPKRNFQSRTWTQSRDLVLHRLSERQTRSHSETHALTTRQRSRNHPQQDQARDTRVFEPQNLIEDRENHNRDRCGRNWATCRNQNRMSAPSTITPTNDTEMTWESATVPLHPANFDPDSSKRHKTVGQWFRIKSAVCKSAVCKKRHAQHRI